MKKKLLAMILSIAMVFSVAACGPDLGGDDDTTTIYMAFSDSGLGLNWAYDMETRFNAEYENYQIPGVEGKTGIKISIRPGDIGLIDRKNSAVTTATWCAINDATAVGSTGYAYDLTDIMTEKYDDRNGVKVSILDKLVPEAKSLYQSSVTGQCFCLPHVEYGPVLTYCKNTFDRNGLYFANVEDDGTYKGDVDVATDAVEFKCDVTGKTFYFTNAEDVNGVDNNSNLAKACGPDGVMNTDDDGMASSLIEFIALCNYMKSEFNVSPFVQMGSAQNYSNWLPIALLTALQGYEKALSMYTFDSSKCYTIDGTPGKIDVVTGWTGEQWLPGSTGIVKPKLAQVELSQANGFYTTWMAEKYYVEAFVQLAVDKNWYSDSSFKSTQTNKTAMSEFIFAGFPPNEDEQIGMLCENSFWYQEAASAGYHQRFYDKYMDGHIEREIYAMSLPVHYDKSVNMGEIEGAPHTMIDGWNSRLYVNSNITGNAEMEHAIKVVIQWMYSDKELANFISNSNLFNPINIQLSEEQKRNLSTYTKELYELVKEDKDGDGIADRGRVIYESGGPNNPTFDSNVDMMTRDYEAEIFAYGGFATSFAPQYNANKDSKTNRIDAMMAFQSDWQRKTLVQWRGMYKGGPSTDVKLYEGINFDGDAN